MEKEKEKVKENLTYSQLREGLILFDKCKCKMCQYEVKLCLLRIKNLQESV
jgi:hypothetical protein